MSRACVVNIRHTGQRKYCVEGIGTPKGFEYVCKPTH